MRIINLGRGEGKTERLIDWLLDGKPVPGATYSWGRLVVVSDQPRVAEIRRRLDRRLGHPQSPVPGETSELSNQAYATHPWTRVSILCDHVLTANQMIMPGRRIHPTIEIAIDDLDDVLFGLFGIPVSLVTLSPGPVVD